MLYNRGVYNSMLVVEAMRNAQKLTGKKVVTAEEHAARGAERDPDGGDETLGLVDFAIFPHLDYPGWDENTLECAREWAARIGIPSYAIDDQTAISVVDGAVEVISEGHWEQFPAT